MIGGAVGAKFGIGGCVGLGGVTAGAEPFGPSPGRAEPEAVRRPVTVDGRDGGAVRFATGGAADGVAEAGADAAAGIAVSPDADAGAAAGAGAGGVAFVTGAAGLAGSGSVGSDFFTTLRAAVRPSVALEAGFGAGSSAGCLAAGLAASDPSTDEASVPVSTATAVPPPENQSRIVAARPAETGERCVEMSGISSDWHFAMMSFEVTPSSFASWWTLRLAFFVVDKIWSPGCVRPYVLRLRS